MVKKQEKYLWRERPLRFARDRYHRSLYDVFAVPTGAALQGFKDLLATGRSAIHVTVAHGTVHERALSGEDGMTNPSDVISVAE